MKLGYEIRSTNVHEQMLQMWRRNFDVKIVPQSKVCIVFYANSLFLSTLVLFFNSVYLLNVI